MGERGRDQHRLRLVRETARRLRPLRVVALAALPVQRRQMEVHLAQPSGMRRALDMLDAPLQVRDGGVAFTETGGNAGPNDPRHPAHEELLAAGHPLGIVEHRKRFAHPADPAQQRHLARVARPQ
jgi:hypothetical protein